MSQIIEHPSHFISSGLKEQIRNYSTEAEKLGELHPKQLQTINERKWFNLFVPKEYGGLELDLIQGLQLEEAFSWIDGSFG